MCGVQGWGSDGLRQEEAQDRSAAAEGKLRIVRFARVSPLPLGLRSTSLCCPLALGMTEGPHSAWTDSSLEAVMRPWTSCSSTRQPMRGVGTAASDVVPAIGMAPTLGARLERWRWTANLA